MEGGQLRRFRRRARGQTQTILPLRSTPLSNTISCWYCDLKISTLNEPLYRFGQKHARFLRVWFTIGIGFSLSVLFGVSMVLVWELLATLFLPYGSKMSSLFSSIIFGFNPSVFIFKMSLIDVGHLIVSTMISVMVHEFGHAVAAASEGIQLEYIAIFLAVLFPGALVALNYELLQTKPHATALRIYCAGIWHNAVCCAVCGLALLLLPAVLSPLYVHGEGPMVLDVSPSSPLAGYLSPGDAIISLNGIKIRNSLEWMEMAILLEKQTRQNTEAMKGSLSINRRMVYCAPSSLLQQSERLFIMANQSCPEDHIAFVSIPCSDFNEHFVDGEYDLQKIGNHGYCIRYADVAKLRNCGRPGTTTDGRSNCICSEDELCVSPVQMPGITWAEIAYWRPYSLQCAKLEKNMTEPVENSDSGEDCHKTFLYMGDVISMARSVRLTSFQPRFTAMFGAYMPDMFEKIFVCTFQVSVALALLNSLPVYFLDGESILEVCSFYINFLSPGKKRLCLRACLLAGSIISCLIFLKIFLIRFWSLYPGQP